MRHTENLRSIATILNNLADVAEEFEKVFADKDLSGYEKDQISETVSNWLAARGWGVDYCVGFIGNQWKGYEFRVGSHMIASEVMSRDRELTVAEITADFDQLRLHLRRVNAALSIKT